ncbi:MAG: hypothetical protein HY040_05515 [Planctomycetes bacterium]|nr:hypothetical protein [Planctomycetota bacterium]
MDERLNEIKAPAGWRRLFVLTALAGLFAWQGWLTLGLFGPGEPWTDEPWSRLLDDEPILSGAHPQHLYLGWLGAHSLWESGRLCVLDPAFQAVFPKTPIFNGSRPAEVFLYLAGGSYNPAAYKVGVALTCLLVPLLLWMACRGAGLNDAATIAATAVGILLWWGPAGRAALEAGESELLLASLALLAHMAMLVRFDRAPGFWAWFGMFATGCLGWFLQPLLFPIALPLLLIYYLSAGSRHAGFSWHFCLLLAEAGGLAVNLPWLLDWVGYWWLRSPLPAANDMLPHRTFATLWNAPLWSGSVERGLAVGLLGSAAGGALIWNQTRERPAARLFGLGAAFLLILAFLGVSWEPLGKVGTSILLVPALWFAALPAAHAWTCLVRWLYHQGDPGRALLVGVVILAIGAGAWFRDVTLFFAQRGMHVEPLQIGLGGKRTEVVNALVAYTSPDARILWEDRRMARAAPRWSALLPILTERSFMGGLDPDGIIEHSSISFVDEALEGKPIGAWSDHALEEYCRRYNVGWAVCWTERTTKRFREWPGAEAIAELGDDVPGTLFLIRGAPHSFTVKGQAKLVHADAHHITLADLVPENGVIVLSMHHQTGLRATPGRVQVESQQSGRDPIGFIRLRVAGPVARVTLTWGDR